MSIVYGINNNTWSIEDGDYIVSFNIKEIEKIKEGIYE